MPDGSNSSFNYDPSQYVTAATNWANTQAGRGDTMFNWGQDQFNKNAATSDQVIQAALRNAGIFDDAAAAGVSRYEQMYAPAMQQQLDFARNYASPENLALYRGQAMAGVGQAYDQQAKAASDSLRSYGLNPADISARLDTSVRTKRAADEAGAGTSSDVNNKLIGQQLLGQAIQTGQADAGVTNAFGSTGAANRNQAVNTGLATTASGSATMGTPQSWASLGNTELAEWPKAEQASYTMANNYNSLQNQINATNNAYQLAMNQQGSGFGALAGAGIGGLSNIFKGSGSSIMNMFSGGGGGAAGGAASAGGADAIMGLQASKGAIVPHYVEGGNTGTGSDWASGLQYPGDPLYGVWEGLAPGDAPVYDQGEQLGSGAGGMAGGLVGSMFGPIGQVAGREIGQRAGAGIGAAVQGDWGGAAKDLAAGTPLTFLFADGGVTPQVTGQDTPGGLPATAAPPAGAIQTGQVVPGSAAVPGIQGPDKVPAMVQPGEGIIPKPVMEFIGQQGFQAFLDKAYKAMGMGPQPPAKGEAKPMPPQAMRTGPTFASQGAMA